MSGGTIEDRKASLGKLAKRIFSTGPTAAILDPRPTALDFRTLLLISLFDGQTRLRGKGAGCHVSNRRLADILGCDYGSLSKCIRKLREWGYITEERGNAFRPNDRRMTTYRVEFPNPDSWLVEQLSCPEIVGLLATKANKVVGLDESENGEILPETDKYYSPQRGELDSAKAGKLDSENLRVLQNATGSATGNELSNGAQLAMFERDLREKPHTIDLVKAANWLADTIELCSLDDPNVCARAVRLAEKVDDMIEHHNRQGRPNPMRGKCRS